MDSSATHQLTSQFPALRLSVARRMAGYRERLAKRVSDEMAQRSWSVDDLAYKSGVSAKTIKRLQNAKHDPRPSTVRRIAEGFSLDPAELGPEAEADQLRRVEEKLDEVLVLLRSNAQAEKVAELVGEARAEGRKPSRSQPRKRGAGSG